LVYERKDGSNCCEYTILSNKRVCSRFEENMEDGETGNPKQGKSGNNGGGYRNRGNYNTKRKSQRNYNNNPRNNAANQALQAMRKDILTNLHALHEDFKKTHQDSSFRTVEANASTYYDGVINKAAQKVYKYYGSRQGVNSLLIQLGRKMANENVRDFDTLNLQQKTKYLTYLLVDDLSDVWDWVKDKAKNVHGLWDKVKGLIKPHYDNAANSIANAVNYIAPGSGDAIRTGAAWLKDNINWEPESTVNGYVPVGTSAQAYNVSIPRAPRSAYGYDAVCTEYIACWIDPFHFSSRMPTASTVSSALSTGHASVTLTSNASGSLGIYLYPSQIINSNSARFLAVFNDATFSPTTGVQTPAPTWTSGPMVSNVANVNAIRIVSMSMEIMMSASALSSSGVAYGVHFQQPINSTTTTPIPTTSLTEATNQPFVQMKTFQSGGMRYNFVYNDDYDSSYTQTSGSWATLAMESGYYFVLMNGPASLPCITATYSWVAEYVPSSTIYALVNMQPPPPGTASIQFAVTLSKLMPQLVYLAPADSFELASYIKSLPTMKYDDLLNAVLEKASVYKHTPMTTAVDSTSAGLGSPQSAPGSFGFGDVSVLAPSGGSFE
jgi:hypothetical protein